MLRQKDNGLTLQKIHAAWLKLAGKAEQLTVINGRSLQGLVLWMAAAINSFPVMVLIAERVARSSTIRYSN
jgi:hypothetical protein